MAKVTIEGAGEFYHHYPRVATIVTTHARGRDNAMACAWHSPLSFTPPLFGVSIRQTRYTYELILEGKEFGVNFVPFELAEQIASIGGSRGRDMDKFEHFGVEREKPSKTSVPLLRDAYAAYECRLVDRRTYGDHDWLVGEIVCAHFLEEVFTDKEVMDLERVRPALYLGGEFYAVTAKEPIRHLDREVYGKR